MLTILLTAVILLSIVAIAAWRLYRTYPVKLILQSKQHLESIFDSIPDPIAIISPALGLSRVNRAYAALTGRRFQEILGNPCHRFFPKTEASCPECLVTKVLETGKAQVSTGRCVRLQGERYYDIYFFPLKDKQTNTVRSVVEYIKDVTEETLAKRQLQEAKANLEHALGLLQEEINLAKEIQCGILPTHCPEIEGVKVTASYTPVASVGGDLYDFVPLGNYRFGIFLGDVSGHGLPAAFVGAMTKMSLYTHSQNNLSPKSVLEKINDDLNRNISTGHYLTGIYGILDVNDNSFTYTRASHPFPVIVHADGSTDILDTPGIFIGMVEEPKYGMARVELQPGDRMFLFTDGFYEFHDETQAMLGREGFTQLLVECQNHPINGLPDHIDKRVREYYGGKDLDDDRSLIVLEITERSRRDRFRLLCDFDKEENIVVASFRTYREGDAYVSMILREMDRLGYRDDCIRRMKMVVTELFSNGIEHGNNEDSSKKLDIAFVVDQEKVKIACVDEGAGFRVADVPDPTAEENLLKDRGRGIHIIKTFADEILQNEKGNRVTILKYKKSKKNP